MLVSIVKHEAKALNKLSGYQAILVTKDSIIFVVIDFRMFLELLLDVVHLFLSDISSTDGTSFVLRHLVFNLTSEFVLFPGPLHEPIPVHADEMESVEALVDSHEIRSVSKLLFC